MVSGKWYLSHKGHVTLQVSPNLNILVTKTVVKKSGEEIIRVVVGQPTDTKGEWSFSPACFYTVEDWTQCLKTLLDMVPKKGEDH